MNIFENWEFWLNFYGDQLMEEVGQILEDPQQLASLTIGKNSAGELAVVRKKISAIFPRENPIKFNFFVIYLFVIT